MKLKEWQFEKNLSATDMSIIVTKREKRLGDEGKETLFFRSGVQIRDNKFDNFKKRKTSKILMDMASPNAGKSCSI